jgi:phytoene dehydrogenase-like protein
LDRQTDNDSLKDILTQFFFKKTPTYFALGYFHVWLDYFYPKGGTGALPKLLNEKILKDGGKIKLNTKIKEIIPSELKVIDLKGNEYRYDHLIWASDLKMLYKDLNTTNLSEESAKKIALQSEKVALAKPSESTFILNLAINRPASYFEKKGGSHLFYTPSKQGLGKTSKFSSAQALTYLAISR